MRNILQSAPFISRAWLCLSVFVCACQSSGGPIEQLDSQSGLTIVTDRRPVAFSRTETRFSRSARDYVYLGSVEINERGSREYYLWVGMASTIDRGFVAAEETMPDLMYLDLAGEPVEFELVAWDERVSRLAGREIYDPAVTPARILAARVTASQLSLISESRPISVRVATRDQPTKEYLLWSDESQWAGFSSYSVPR
jgi:hypothetical protein